MAPCYELPEFLKICEGFAFSGVRQHDELLKYLSTNQENEATLFTTRSVEYTNNLARGVMYTQPKIFEAISYTPLHFACAGSNKNILIVEEILKRLSGEAVWETTRPKPKENNEENKEEISQEEGGWNALHHASYNYGGFGKFEEIVEVVDALLFRCSGERSIAWALNQRTPEGFTPLFLACMSRNDKLIAKYLALGADPFTQDNKGNTVIHALVGWGQNDRSDKEGEEVIASIKHFQSLGVDINKKNNKGKSALCYCAYKNCHFFLKFVELGGDLSVVDNHGRNLFHVIGRKCDCNSHTERLLKIVLDYLKEKGQKGLIDVNAFDLDGRTPLMHLWFRQSFSIEQFLEKPTEEIVKCHHLFVSCGASVSAVAPMPAEGRSEDSPYPMTYPLLHQVMRCGHVKPSNEIKIEEGGDAPEWKFLWDELTKTNDLVGVVDSEGNPPSIALFKFNRRYFVSDPIPMFKALLEKGADPFQKAEKKEEKKEEKKKEEEKESKEEKALVAKIEGTSIRALMNWGFYRSRPEGIKEGLNALVANGSLSKKEVEILLQREKRKEEERKKANEPSSLQAAMGIAVLGGVLAVVCGTCYGLYWGVSTFWAFVLSLIFG